MGGRCKKQCVAPRRARDDEQLAAGVAAALGVARGAIMLGEPHEDADGSASEERLVVVVDVEVHADGVDEVQRLVALLEVWVVCDRAIVLCNAMERNAMRASRLLEVWVVCDRSFIVM